MQFIQLLINGNTLLLSDKTRIGVTYQANDIGELQKRQGVYTNTFKIPLHSHNMKVLEWSNLMTSATDMPYKKNLATYIEEGIEIVSDGEAIIQKSDQDFIYLNFVGGNVDLSKAIGDVTFGDLYENDPTHTWNLINVFSSRLNNEYYIYPFVDWRTDIDTFYDSATVDARQMIPLATARGFFQRLELYTGYTFTGAYIGSKEHSNMMISPSDFTKNPDFFDEENQRAKRLNSKANIIVDAAVDSGVNSSVRVIDYDTFENGFSLFTNNVYFPPVSEVANLNFRGQIKWTYQYVGSSGIINADIEFFYYIVQIKDNLGAVLAQQQSQIFEHDAVFDNDPHTLVDDLAFSINTGDITLIAGVGYFTVVTGYLHGREDVFTRATFQLQKGATFERFPKPAIVFGNEIRFRDLFRMKAKDVLKDILNLRGLIIQTNSYTREVQFNFFQDLYNNMPIAKDWSAKIDIRSHSLFFKFGKYAQRNNLIFKEREDVPDGLGNHYFEVDDQTLDAESDVVKMMHPATVEQNRYLGGNVPMIEAMDSLNVWNKPDWRILQLDSQNTPVNTGFTDGTTTVNAMDNIPFARFVGFDELVPEFYEVLTGILDRAKVISLSVKLNAIDIQELDFSIPIILDVPELDINGYFYINKISNYKQGFTPVEFVRL
jgi:hypothetical protein